MKKKKSLYFASAKMTKFDKLILDFFAVAFVIIPFFAVLYLLLKL